MHTRRRWPWIAAGVTTVVAIGAVVAALVIFAPPHRPALTPPDDLDAAIERIEAAVPGALEASRVPGAAISIVRDGRPVWSEGFGTADDGAAVTSGTLFQVGSISKPVAAATILALVDDGILDLDAPVSEYLGSWRVPGGSDEVTLRRLLGHTAGISVPGYLGTPADDALPTTLGSLEGADGEPVRKTSEIDRYAYSGGGYTIAQLAAETVTGRPFAQLATELVLRPRGMDASGYACTTTEPDDATGHDTEGRAVSRYLYTEAAAAGLCSTADDLALFVAWLASGSPAAELMAAASTGTDGGYGLGLELGSSADGRPVVAHPGVNRGYVSYIAVVPAAGFGIAILTDGDGGSAVIDSVLGAITP